MQNRWPPFTAILLVFGYLLLGPTYAQSAAEEPWATARQRGVVYEDCARNAARLLNGWIDEKRAALEILTSIRRAGAKLILTYWAKDAAQWLSES